MKSLCVLVVWLFAVWSASLGQTKQEKSYTIVDPSPEFLREKDPAKRIAMLDGTMAKHPNPNRDVLQYTYLEYLRAYGELKNRLKVMEYADKLSTLGDQIGPGMRFNAAYVWTAAYNELNSKDPQLATKAREHIAEALKFLSEIQKPQNMDDQQWQELKSKWRILLQDAADKTAIVLRDSLEKRPQN